MAAHALLGASSSERWMRCPGSVAACKDLTDTGSKYAAEGTAAHALAEHCLVNSVHPSACLGMTFEGFTVDGEMAENVQMYVDYVRQLSGEHFYEVQVDFSPWVHEGFGTADAIVINTHTKTLYVIDLKYGKGVQVDADNNSQAQLYALGAINEYGHICDIETIQCVIVQPRLDNISEWQIDHKTLMSFGAKVSQAAEEALKPNAKRYPGEKQCQWCRAKATCPALKDYTEQTLLVQFDDISPSTLKPVDQLTDEQLAQALEAKKLIAGWLDAVEDQVTAKLLNGETFPGYKLVEGRSLRQWADEVHAQGVLSRLYLDDLLYKKTFISPAQAEKLVGKKELHVLDGLIVKPAGKPTLAPADDKRPAIGATIIDFDACND